MSVAAVPLSVSDRDRYIKYARLLAWSSLLWMTAEGPIALGAEAGCSLSRVRSRWAGLL